MKDILLLHGAIGAASQLQPLAAALKNDFNVHLINLPGHGGEEMPGDFNIGTFANVVLEYLDSKNIATISIFGYSMGGYIALQLAKTNPERIEKIITLATKFHWDEGIAAREVKMLQADIIEEKLPGFAAELQQRHYPVDWKLLLKNTQKLLTSLGKDAPLKSTDYPVIQKSVLVMLGDNDRMVSLIETVDTFNKLPHGYLAILPDTAHPVEKTDLDILSFYIRKHFN